MLSAAIMAHPKRMRFVRRLQQRLPDAELVLDTKNDRWDTGTRSLLAYDQGADHHVVVQDDAIVCGDFIEGCQRAADVAGEHPIALYTGRTQARRAYTVAAERALRRRTAWISGEGPHWGVAIILPTDHIADMIEWCRCNCSHIRNYDARIATYYAHRDLDCWYTVPSLVNHREVSENPSLIGGRSGNRTAFNFIGDRSPLRVRWETPPVPVKRASEHDTMTRPRRLGTVPRAT